MNSRIVITVLAIGLLITNVYGLSCAAIYGGVDFPEGEVSFADEWILYQPTADVLAPHNDPSEALGIPDYVPKSGQDYVSLGDGGVLVLKFSDNSLTTSMDDTPDLWIFEIGEAIEPTAVEISTNGTDWVSVGDTTGGTSGIDIDAYLTTGIVLGEKYSYVKLTDLLPHQSGSPYEGADIDAVGAISSSSPVPLPGAIWLLGSGIAGIAATRRKR